MAKTYTPGHLPPQHKAPPSIDTIETPPHFLDIRERAYYLMLTSPKVWGNVSIPRVILHTQQSIFKL